jgi:hypothetical protein
MLLSDAFLEPLHQAMGGSFTTRNCPVIDDHDFAVLCVQRVLQSSKSGRDFLQCHGMPYLPGLNRPNYFKSLGSNRRRDLMIRLAAAMRDQHLPGLRAHDDTLSAIPELNGWEVWAGDGHGIAHATHDPRNAKDAYLAVHAIYKLDLRTNWVDFVDLVPPTERGREHELKTLKRQDKEQLRCGAGKGRQVLMVYDRAIVDFLFAYNLKHEENLEDTKVIKAWLKDLTKRVEAAREAGRTFPEELYQALYRPTEVSLQFIRWLRSTLFRPTCYRAALEILRPLMLKYL